MQLRAGGGAGSSNSRTSVTTSTSTHLIVDFVFSTLDTTVQDSCGEGEGVSEGEEQNTGESVFMLLFSSPLFPLYWDPKALLHLNI